MPIEVFGAGAVQTAYVSYLPLDIRDHSITLIWPTSYQNSPAFSNGVYTNVLAASMNVTTGFANAHTITLPDATQSTVGANFIITNIGVSSFDVLKRNGGVLLTVPAIEGANSYWVQLIDNSTAIGGWQYLQFGAGSSQAQAAELAGNGLTAIASRLNTNIPVQSKIDPFLITTADRANLFIWRGGTDNLTLPNILSVPAGFYFSLNNEGGGILTIGGDALIDGSGAADVAPKESLTIVSDGVAWWTLGFGQNQFSSLFVNGNEAHPSISFVNDDTTGVYYNPAPLYMGVSVSGSAIATINSYGLKIVSGKKIAVNDSTNTYQTNLSTTATDAVLTWTDGILTVGASLSGTADQTNFTVSDRFTLSQDDLSNHALIVFNSVPSVQITSTGVVSFPNTPPFTLAQGGTGASTQVQAANNILPTAGFGDIIYNDGTDWVILPQGADGQVLTVVAGVPAWA